MDEVRTLPGGSPGGQEYVVVAGTLDVVAQLVPDESRVDPDGQEYETVAFMDVF